MEIIKNENIKNALATSISNRLQGFQQMIDHVLIKREIDHRTINISRSLSRYVNQFEDILSEKNKNGLEKAIHQINIQLCSQNKDFDLKKLNYEEINELLINECYDCDFISYERAFQLLDNGADVRYHDESGFTAFFYASISDYLKLNQLFLERGGDLNDNYKTGEYDTIWLMNHHFLFEKMKLYIEFGANVNATNANKDTILHRIALNYTSPSYVNCLDLLIKNGADINAKNNDGLTPLMQSINSKTTKIFLDFGADIDLTDNYSNTALIHAVQQKSIEIVKLLLNYKANKDIKNSDGLTAYDIAISNGDENIARLFYPISIVEQDLIKYKNSVLEIRKQIIEKLKNGECFESIRGPGFIKLVYQNGEFILTESNQFYGDSKTIFNNDEKLLKQLYSLLFIFKSELKAYQEILSKIK